MTQDGPRPGVGADGDGEDRVDIGGLPLKLLRQLSQPPPLARRLDVEVLRSLVDPVGPVSLRGDPHGHVLR